MDSQVTELLQSWVTTSLMSAFISIYLRPDPPNSSNARTSSSSSPLPVKSQPIHRRCERPLRCQRPTPFENNKPIYFIQLLRNRAITKAPKLTSTRAPGAGMAEVSAATWPRMAHQAMPTEPPPNTSRTERLSESFKS